MPRDWRLSLNNATVSTRPAWREVAELAARQHGVVALWQLVELGVPAGTVRSWVAIRRLVRLHQGVFAVGHACLRAEGRYLGAVLACGRGAVLSHRSAAALWGIRRSAASRLDVTAAGRTGRKKPGLRVHTAARLHDDEITVARAVPCTTVARTLLDLASELDRRGAEAAVESSERLELFDLRSLTILLARHRGRRGTRTLRDVLGAFNAEVLRARSETEARFFHLCVDQRLPEPRVNRVVDTASESFEVDFHWADARLIAEADSPFHDTTAAIIRDARRDALLRQAGWTIMRCRWDDIVPDPTSLVARIRARLSSTGASGAFR